MKLLYIGYIIQAVSTIGLTFLFITLYREYKKDKKENLQEEVQLKNIKEDNNEKGETSK